jgi:tripartite-type tricarboxylate transporter receptor subunit TctC
MRCRRSTVDRLCQTRQLVGAALCVAALLASAEAGAQANYPDGPVRIIVGFTAGSATDIAARMFVQKFNEIWKVPVTVENIAGAGGVVAADRVAKAAPDGATLMWSANGALTIAPALQSRLSYDPARDFAPISQVLRMPSILAVNNDLPAKSFAELIALAKAQPGKLSYATPGIGTPQHIGGELLKMMAGIDITHVPYRGAVLTDVIGGRVPIVLSNAGAILPTVREGKLRGLAITALERSPNVPRLPTIAESGFPGFEATSWFALLAPAGTPASIVGKVQREARAIGQEPEMQAKLAQLGLDVVGSAPADLAAIIKADIAKWSKVIAESGIKAGEYPRLGAARACDYRSPLVGLRDALRAYMARSARSNASVGWSSGRSSAEPAEAPTASVAPAWVAVVRVIAASSCAAFVCASASVRCQSSTANSSPPRRATTSEART